MSYWNPLPSFRKSANAASLRGKGLAQSWTFVGSGTPATKSPANPPHSWLIAMAACEPMSRRGTHREC